MKRMTKPKTVLFEQPTNEREHFSAASLRRLLRTLPSWNRWPILRSYGSSLVERLRLIAEIVIWGDQHDAAVFAVFQKENGMGRLMRILSRKSNRHGPVAVQMLQTFAMLVQNLRTKESLAYLLSHEATRQIISMDFDFSDEEVLGYYVSFVKSISFKLNESSVSSFTRKQSPRSDVVQMPLFSEVTKFVDNPERMVRAAARTLTLSIMGMKNEVVDRYLVSNESRGFFRNQVTNLHNKIKDFRQLDEATTKQKDTKRRRDQLVAEIEDVVCYLNDIYTCGSKCVQMELASAVWDEMLGDHLILPLFNVMNRELRDKISTQAMSEEGRPLLRLPKVETLMSVASDWIPVMETDFHKSMFTTFVASTMNVLLRRSDFMYSRVIMRLINQAFQELNKAAHERHIPLVNVDLETLDLNDDPEWRIEATKVDAKMKLNLYPTVGLLEFADYIGLSVCVDVLRTLFHQTKCKKYKPSSLLETLARNPRSLFKGRRFIPFTQSMKSPIKSAVSLKSVHRRLSSLAEFSTPRNGTRRTRSVDGESV